MIVGIDRFMSEARALTNFTGNAVATVLIGTWVKEIDGGQVNQVLSGELPFDEQTMIAGQRRPGARGNRSPPFRPLSRHSPETSPAQQPPHMAAGAACPE